MLWLWTPMKSQTSLGNTYENIYSKNVGKPKGKKMGEFPNAYDWPKLKPAEINNLKDLL